MAEPITISAVIPCYNSSRTLERAVASVLNQTHPVDEIIVADDGSTDGSWALIGRLGPRVKGVRRTNGGPAAARNTGTQAATSKWIAYLDSDDEWLPEKIARQVAVVSANPGIRWCATNMVVVHADREEPFAMPDAAARQIDAHACFDDYLDAQGWCVPVQPSAVLIEADLVRSVGGWDEALVGPEDLFLWYNLALVAPKLGYVREHCIRYYDDAPSSVSKWSNQGRYKLMMAEKALAIWNGDHPRGSTARRQLRNLAFRTLLKTSAADAVDFDLAATIARLPLTAVQRAVLESLRRMPLAVRRRLQGRIRDVHRLMQRRHYAPARP